MPAPRRIPTPAEINDLTVRFERLQDQFDAMPVDTRIPLWPIRTFIRDLIQQLRALSLDPSAKNLRKLAKQIGSTADDLDQMRSDLNSIRTTLTTTAALLNTLSPILALV